MVNITFNEGRSHQLMKNNKLKVMALIKEVTGCKVDAKDEVEFVIGITSGMEVLLVTDVQL